MGWKTKGFTVFFISSYSLKFQYQEFHIYDVCVYTSVCICVCVCVCSEHTLKLSRQFSAYSTAPEYLSSLSDSWPGVRLAP